MKMATWDLTAASLTNGTARCLLRSKNKKQCLKKILFKNSLLFYGYKTSVLNKLTSVQDFKKAVIW